jgi:hypothetical protein
MVKWPGCAAQTSDLRTLRREEGKNGGSRMVLDELIHNAEVFHLEAPLAK